MHCKDCELLRRDCKMLVITNLIWALVVVVLLVMMYVKGPTMVNGIKQYQDFKEGYQGQSAYGEIEQE